MKFEEKLIKLRRERGYSQEQLADLLGISRQAVSKWESGSTMPDINKLATLADLFGVTLDDLIRDRQEPTAGQTVLSATFYPSEYEYKSKRTLWGLPLVHIHTGRGLGMPRVAKGIVAIGDVAVGVVSLGGIAVGGLSLGGLSLGALVALGGGAIGGIALGGFALGIVALGGLAIGVVATGGMAVGVYALGGGAIASQIAVGASATAPIAAGVSPSGEAVLQITDATTRAQLQAFLLEHRPNLWQPLLQFLSWIVPY